MSYSVLILSLAGVVVALSLVYFFSHPAPADPVTRLADEILRSLLTEPRSWSFNTYYQATRGDIVINYQFALTVQGMCLGGRRRKIRKALRAARALNLLDDLRRSQV